MSDAAHYVFDAEPLIAHAADEVGADTVNDLLAEVQDGDADGSVSMVTLTEVHYILARADTESAADQHIRYLTLDIGLDQVAVTEYDRASVYRRTYGMALGDSFAAQLADQLDATLICGGDDCFDGVTELDIEQFRTGSSKGGNK